MKKTAFVLFLIGFLISVALVSAEGITTKADDVIGPTTTVSGGNSLPVPKPEAISAPGGGYGVKGADNPKMVTTSAVAPTVVAVSSQTEERADSYRDSYWQCYDGYEENSGGTSSCKPSYVWAGYAKESCNGHCSKETGKCGVNTFRVSTPCESNGAYPKIPTATASPAPAYLVPACNINKENIEGWYINNELIMKDNCLCRAECRNIDSENEGYYSTCLGTLIQKKQCSANIQPKAVITVKEQPPVAQQTLTVATSEGEKDIKYVSEEAKLKAMKETGLFDVTSIEVKNGGDKPIYEIQGKREEKLFYIFPITREKTVMVDAVTNNVISVKDTSTSPLFTLKADSKKE